MMQAPPPRNPPLPSGNTAAAPAPAGPQINAALQFDRSERWLIPNYFQNIRDRQRRASRYKIYPRDLPAGLTQAPAPGDLLPPAILRELKPLPQPSIPATHRHTPLEDRG